MVARIIYPDINGSSAYPGGKINNVDNSYSYWFQVSPDMDGAALAVSDVIALNGFSYNQVVQLYMNHSDTDATLALTPSLAVATTAHDEEARPRVALDKNGAPLLLDPAYFGDPLTFTSERFDDHNLYRGDARKGVVTIGDAVTFSPTSIANFSQKAVLVFVVGVVPTGTIKIAMHGSLRGY